MADDVESAALPLKLERAISNQPAANLLAMPLARKLGEISSYNYVYADALPLRMERRISEQPVSNALHLAMTNLHGVLIPPVYVKSNALPFPLSIAISDQPSPDVLPLSLSRKLGTLNSAPIIVPPIDPEPPKSQRKMEGVASWFGSRTPGALPARNCETWRHDALPVSYDYIAMRSPVTLVSQAYSMQILGLIPILDWVAALSLQSLNLLACKSNTYVPFIPIYKDAHIRVSASVGYVRCVKAHSDKVIAYRQCASMPLQPAISYAIDSAHQQYGRSVSQCQRSKVSKAIPVPCRYYPIPEPPPDKPINSCRIRPPSSELPLRMARRRGGLLSSNLPLSMTCWHDDPPLSIPNLRSYIVHNVITATIGGITVDPISFSIKTDMHGFCWQGDIEITKSDYAKIKNKLEVARGSEPLINVVINGMPFTIIAEEQRRSRRFASHTHNISGRSITARLGADYAKAQSGLLDQDNYASQLVSSQLVNQPASLADWDISDWLIPADSYAVSGKTPIAVVKDIADAAGGFVLSDPSAAVLSLKPRWPYPAWELATAVPDVTIPADVIRKIDDQKRINTRYNTVTLSGPTEGGHVYRETQGRDAEAPTHDHLLYTDRDVILPAGIAILSDSGTHRDYTLTMRWTDKYNVPLALLGHVWQINDPEGYWRGVVTGVSVNVSREGDVPTIWQTVNIDRYMDA